MLSDKVTPVIARQVLWVFSDREHGQEPGGFFLSLLDAMCHADPENMARLELGFPGHTEAVLAAKYTTVGMDRLRVRAGEPDA